MAREVGLGMSTRITYSPSCATMMFQVGRNMLTTNIHSHDRKRFTKWHSCVKWRGVLYIKLPHTYQLIMTLLIKIKFLLNKYHRHLEETWNKAKIKLVEQRFNIKSRTPKKKKKKCIYFLWNVNTDKAISCCAANHYLTNRKSNLCRETNYFTLTYNV